MWHPYSIKVRPPRTDHPLHGYRPWKTILVRTVADGGWSFDIRGDHRHTILSLRHGLRAWHDQ